MHSWSDFRGVFGIAFSVLLEEKMERVFANRCRIPDKFLNFEHIGWKYEGSPGRLINHKLEGVILRHHASSRRL